MEKIALIGDLIRDIFIYGSCERMNPEGPYPLVSQQNLIEKNGGAGNVYENLNSLGLDVRFYHLDKSNAPRKTRIIVGNSIIFRLDDEKISNNNIFIESLKCINFNQYSYVILSDYNKGTLTNVETLLQSLKQFNCKIIVDPKQDLKKYKGVWCIKPNKKV